METKKKILISISAVLLFAVFLLIFRALADGMVSPQQRAAAELPEVLDGISRTQPCSDDNAKYRSRRQQILDCQADEANCGPFQPGTPSAD